MDFKRHIETAWNLTLRHIVALILITLVLLAVSVFSLGILAPVAFAGYTQSLLLLIRNGREPNARDLFSHMKLFLPCSASGSRYFWPFPSASCCSWCRDWSSRWPSPSAVST
jgi:hypothetical protein